MSTDVALGDNRAALEHHRLYASKRAAVHDEVARAQLAAQAALQADHHEPPTGGEHLHVAAQVRRTHVVQHHVERPGLDEVLGGGFPELSFNLIAGGPGAGKTTIANQIMFATATPERKAVYISIIGEPPIKMLRYQQQYSFFDAAKVGDGTVRFLHLGHEAREGGMAAVLAAIEQELERTNPGIVVVDSFRAMVRSALALGPDGERDVETVCAAVASALGVPLRAVLSASTGVIGVRLPVAKLTAAAPLLAPGMVGAAIGGRF